MPWAHISRGWLPSPSPASVVSWCRSTSLLIHRRHPLNTDCCQTLIPAGILGSSSVSIPEQQNAHGGLQSVLRVPITTPSGAQIPISSNDELGNLAASFNRMSKGLSETTVSKNFLGNILSNMSDAFVNEWPGTLDELKKLDFVTVLPGHGDAYTDRSKIDYFQAYLRDVWTEVSRLKQQGISPEEAARRADLTKHKDHFPIQGPGVQLIAVTRIYEVIDRGGRD